MTRLLYDLTDLQVYIDFLFFAGPAGPCFEEFDTNGDLGIDISDLQTIIDFLSFAILSSACPYGSEHYLVGRTARDFPGRLCHYPFTLSL